MRSWLAPEVIQTSAMDCGPAALRCVLEGFGIQASYGRLREACQTDVDGTSIDTIEDTAVRLGLEASQILLPADQLLLPESKALPAIAVVKLANGGTHFVVVWRKHGPFLQIMDPAHGRRWIHRSRFLEQLYIHGTTVPGEGWKEWSSSEGFQTGLRRRLARLGVPRTDRESLLGGDPASLDAAIRLASALRRSGAISRGSSSAALIANLAQEPDRIPSAYWSARPVDDENVAVRGAVLIHVEAATPKEERRTEDLPEALHAALTEPKPRPWRELFRALADDGWWKPLPVLAAFAVAGAGAVAEALLFRGLLEASHHLVLSGQRLAAMLAFAGFLAGLALIEWAGAGSLLRFGRQLETRLRVRFLSKIPRLGDRYFQSRLVSDMAQRAHSIQHLRTLPELTGQAWRSLCSLACTVAGIHWLYPQAGRWALLAAAFAVLVPLLAQPALAERDSRLREHTGALTRFYLDALLGLTAIRAHAAAGTLRAVQSSLLGDWARAGLRLQAMAVRVEAIQLIGAFAPAIWLVIEEAARVREPAGLLLLIYWALNIPALGQELAAVAWNYPALRNTTLRFLEPLGSPESYPASPEAHAPRRGGAEIEMRGVTVVAGGHTILEDLSLRIAGGSHVGVVGQSGAGKSSLVGLLLGWHTPASGEVSVDGVRLDGERLAALRREIAWIDPQVHLFNETLYGNLVYGSGSRGASKIGQAVEHSNLAPVLQRLPDGLQTELGEGGALLSGGEGQRVRMARAMTRSGTRLVILDEPARGLDHESRREFVERARRYWADATMLCITHDVRDTLGFDRVIVLDAGRVVEDGDPLELMDREDSHFRSLCEAEREVREELWRSAKWRRMRMSEGTLAEEPDHAV